MHVDRRARCGEPAVERGGAVAGGQDRVDVLRSTGAAPDLQQHAHQVRDQEGAEQASQGRTPEGELQERVYDVAWSDGRTPGADGKLPPVGNTVDVANATWTNTIGAPELIAVWEDPDFDPDQRAVYYARVLEIPTPRWTAYEQVRFGIQMGDQVPMITQERAYTSPIWYTP